jgi:hypothetical protein
VKNYVEIVVPAAEANKAGRSRGRTDRRKLRERKKKERTRKSKLEEEWTRKNEVAEDGERRRKIGEERTGGSHSRGKIEQRKPKVVEGRTGKITSEQERTGDGRNVVRMDRQRL